MVSYVIDEKLLRKYYIDDKMTVKQCAEKFGCSTTPIKRAIKEYGINKRGKSEAMKVLFANKKNHPKYGTHWSEEYKRKLSNAQPYKGTHIQTNTGRTHFKEGHECTPNMIDASKRNSYNLHKQHQDYLNNCVKRAWNENYDYMCSTRLRGIYHPNWNEHLDFKKRAYNWLKLQYKWNQKVFERDNYTCQSCGRYGCVLNAHHIKHLSVIVNEFIEIYGEDYEMLKKYDELLDIDNGITLCEDCHKKEHKRKSD